MLEIKEILLRCSICNSEKRFSLNRAQRRQLADGGHLQLHCNACGYPRHWEPKDAVQITSASAKPGRPKSILIVDDDDLTVQLLEKLLSSWEADVDVARDGKEALTKLAFKDFDLLICDIRMPEMDGEELFHQIQQNDLLPAQRIIFLTADKGLSLKQFLDASGCQYLYKPIQFSDLCSEIQEVFSHEPSY